MRTFIYWDNYKYGIETAPTKYNTTDKLNTLEATDDAATVNWGSGCRMPTNDEFWELLLVSDCTWEWTTVNGVGGFKVTGKKPDYAGNSIFLPATGFKGGDKHFLKGETGYYWTSTLYTDHPSYRGWACAYQICEGDLFYNQELPRFWGMSVRPVAEP